MATELPDPLVPADVDIRGFPGFIMEVDRLLASELVALGTSEECWAAMMLWCRAWQQSPPGSLPDDDRVLAAFSKAGSRWKKIRTMALRGFIKCSDGRLYHPVLAEHALKAWGKRKAYKNDQERLKTWRAKRRGNVEETPSEIPDETASETDVKRVSKRVREPSVQEQLQGQVQKNPPMPPLFDLPGVAWREDDRGWHPHVNGYYLDVAFDRVIEAARIDASRWGKDKLAPVVRWLEADIPIETMTAAIRRVAERENYTPPISLQFFDRAVREQRRAA